MKEALLSLPPSDLRTLSAGIRSGRLSEPYPVSSVGRFLKNSVCAGASDGLLALAGTGMSPIALASALDLVASALESRPALHDAVDVVTTTPDTTRIANRDTGVVVSELFRKARTSVLVAGYAVYQGKRVFRALAERMKEQPSLDVRMFLDIQRSVGDTSATEEVVRRFIHRFRTNEWPAEAPVPQIFYDPRSLSPDRNERAALHAKCIVVDGAEVFVSSANFTEAAQQRNIEVGLLLHSPIVAGRLCGFFDYLTDSVMFRKVT